MINPVDAGTFETLVLQSPGPITVEFMSYGCSHCRTMEPVFQEVAKTFASREHFFRVNVALEQILADSYHIRATPTFVMFLNAKEVGRVEGPSPNAASLAAALSAPFSW